MSVRLADFVSHPIQYQAPLSRLVAADPSRFQPWRGMPHERNNEFRRLPAGDHVDAYFGSDDELAERCRYWPSHPDERREVAAGGHMAVVSGNYSHRHRIEEILSVLDRERPR